MYEFFDVYTCLFTYFLAIDNLNQTEIIFNTPFKNTKANAFQDL